MMDGPAAELIVKQSVLSVQQPESVLSGDGLPEPSLGADRAIALARALDRIDLAFEAHGATVAAASVGLLHRDSPCD
jgi:hypothetical protein